MDSRKIPVYNYFKTMTTKKVKMKSHGKYLHKFITLILKKNIRKIEEGLIGSTLLKLPFIKENMNLSSISHVGFLQNMTVRSLLLKMAILPGHT